MEINVYLHAYANRADPNLIHESKFEIYIVYKFILRRDFASLFTYEINRTLIL